jgi:hypothetical protein
MGRADAQFPPATAARGILTRKGALAVPFWQSTVGAEVQARQGMALCVNSGTV